jgi:hypothetical protein
MATTSPESMLKVNCTAGMAQAGPNSPVVAHTLALPGVACGKSTARTKSIAPSSSFFESRGRSRNVTRHGIEGGWDSEALTNFVWVTFLCIVLCYLVVWEEGMDPKYLFRTPMIVAVRIVLEPCLGPTLGMEVSRPHVLMLIFFSFSRQQYRTSYYMRGTLRFVVIGAIRRGTGREGCPESFADEVNRRLEASKA